jgi:hypothetical protein
MTQNVEGYPPVTHLRAHETFKGTCEEDVADQLRKGGIDPEAINTLILRYSQVRFYGHALD